MQYRMYLKWSYFYLTNSYINFSPCRFPNFKRGRWRTGKRGKKNTKKGKEFFLLYTSEVCTHLNGEYVENKVDKPVIVSSSNFWSVSQVALQAKDTYKKVFYVEMAHGIFSSAKSQTKISE